LKKALHYALVLGSICVIAAFGVAGVFGKTKDMIAAKTAAQGAIAQARAVGLVHVGSPSLRLLEAKAGQSPAIEVRDALGKLVCRIEMGDPKAEQGRRATKVRDVDGALIGELLVLASGDTPEEQVLQARRADGKPLGYVAHGAAQGYGGKVRVMVGMGPDAEKIVGVTIVSQSETPGIGSQVAEVKSNMTWGRKLTGKTGEVQEETLPEYLKQFPGKKLDALALGKGINGITGATISSTAVLDAARDAVERIQNAARRKQ